MTVAGVGKINLSPFFLVITSAQIPAPQYELAINATLTNSTSADAQIDQAFNITSQDRIGSRA